MSSNWGENIKFSIFGESHGRAIGINIDGLPEGIELDIENIKYEMLRRSPGKNQLSSSRKEEDSFEILSGYFNSKTTGTPMCAVISNLDTKSSDYDQIRSMPRPGHADYTGYVKYKGNNDYRGGGHFSGRLTAAMVFAGAVSKQILLKKGIIIVSHIYSIAGVKDLSFDTQDIDYKNLYQSSFPVLNADAGEQMKQIILDAKNDGDSVGGIVETADLNVPEGIGSPFFDSVESKISHLLFSIPGIKGVEFGDGFELATMKGSQANDEYYIKNDKIKTYTNHNGGILGGITNGMPVIFRTAVKPTPSIGKTQRTVDLQKKENTQIVVKGRHDPCIVQRALPVIEAAAAMAVIDLI